MRRGTNRNFDKTVLKEVRTPFTLSCSHTHGMQQMALINYVSSIRIIPTTDKLKWNSTHIMHSILLPIQILLTSSIWSSIWCLDILHMNSSRTILLSQKILIRKKKGKTNWMTHNKLCSQCCHRIMPGFISSYSFKTVMIMIINSISVVWFHTRFHSIKLKLTAENIINQAGLSLYHKLWHRGVWIKIQIPCKYNHCSCSFFTKNQLSRFTLVSLALSWQHPLGSG